MVGGLRRRAAQRTLAQREETFKLVQDRVNADLSTYLNVLTAETNVLVQHRTEAWLVQGCRRIRPWTPSIGW